MYNHQFQKLLLVDIKNYKKMSCKYKIGGKNGKGKVYLVVSNKLEYERKYLSGKGKEKEDYYDGKLIFEGEYVKGKKKWERKRI